MEGWHDDRSVCKFLDAVKAAKAHLPTGNWDHDAFKELARAHLAWNMCSPNVLLQRYSQLYDEFHTKYMQSGQRVDFISLKPSESLMYQLMLEGGGKHGGIASQPSERALVSKRGRPPLCLLTCNKVTACAALKLLAAHRVHIHEAGTGTKRKLAESRRQLEDAFPHLVIPSVNTLYPQFVKLMTHVVETNESNPSELNSIIRDMQVEFDKKPPSFEGQVPVDDMVVVQPRTVAAGLSQHEQIMLCLTIEVRRHGAHLLAASSQEEQEEIWQRVYTGFSATSVGRKCTTFTAEDLKKRFLSQMGIIKSNMAKQDQDKKKVFRSKNVVNPLAEHASHVGIDRRRRRLSERVPTNHNHRCSRISKDRI